MKTFVLYDPLNDDLAEIPSSQILFSGIKSGDEVILSFVSTNEEGLTKATRITDEKSAVKATLIEAINMHLIDRPFIYLGVL